MSKLRKRSSVPEVECFAERKRTKILKELSEGLQKMPLSQFSRDAFRKLFQDEVFSKRLFALFDQDEKDALKQDEWIQVLKKRSPSERHSEFVSHVESVAYVLCGDEPINRATFRQIFQAKVVSEQLFRLIDLDNAELVTSEQIMDFLVNISNTRSRPELDEQHLEWLEKIFKQTVGNEREIRREEFKKIVSSKNPFFTDRVFQIFDKDNSGSISLQEFLDAMHQFAGISPHDKLKFLFKVYDIDGDGLIQHQELEHVMRACMIENGMLFSDEQIEDLTLALFEEADQASRGAITFEALKWQLERHEGLIENLSISIDRWMVPPKPEPRRVSHLRRMLAFKPYQMTKPYIKNNYVYLTFLLAFVLVNLLLFLSRMYQYRHSNGYVMFARACGQCLNFDCSFVLVLMLRQSITLLRTHGLGAVLPLDRHIYLHKLTGVLIVAFSALHTLMHLLNFGMIVVNDEQLNSANYTMSEWILTSRPRLFGLVPGAANPTGVVLVLILSVISLCSMPLVRRGGCFEIFHRSHLLYVPFWVLLIFHGPNFWKWFLVPGALFLMEKIRSLSWMFSERGKTYISSGLLLPSKVTHLVIKRPANFDFRPGDYVFVNVPAIARYEWHPFTVSSAPEQESYMWLHIRGVGEWTNSLYSYFEREQMRLHRGQAMPLESDPARAGKLSSKQQDPAAREKRQLPPVAAIENPAFVAESGAVATSNPVAKVSENGVDDRPQNPRVRQLVSTNRAPLEKSHSMPDMQTKSKKRQRMMVLRDYTRSESARSFDECQIRRARLKALGLAYLKPQNKSLAQSFRYMRTKPTIIALKTPSLESCECDDLATSETEKDASNEDDRAGGREDATPEAARLAEEGRVGLVENGGGTSEPIKPEAYLGHYTSMNYPVGKPLEIYLDGPYGAPSSHIFQAQHAVLIATGIGVTPFASILQSIMHRYWKARHTCPKCAFSWASEIPPTVMHLRKVDFFWINRHQRSFEWFINLLSQLEMEQAELGSTMEHFLEMHMYITSALQKNDMKAVGLQLAMDLLHEKEKRDLITGLKTRTNAGRPNWDKVFKQLQDRKKGKVTVFYCGPPQLARILRYKCDQFGFSFSKESF